MLWATDQRIDVEVRGIIAYRVGDTDWKGGVERERREISRQGSDGKRMEVDTSDQSP